MAIVAIVGRPNVGKSTLFNRLTQSRSAIVSEESGTTRDRQYGKVEWGKAEFSIIDTGGLVSNSNDVFEGEIKKHVIVATEEADVIMFMVDVQNGLTDLDLEVNRWLRRTDKPIILVANKTDNTNLQYEAPEFYRLGVGDPHCVSSVSGFGTGDLLDEIVKMLPREEADELFDENLPRIAIVGRPNAGKSSIINAFVGEDRSIVTDIAGTTRDSIYTKYNKFNKEFYLVDTAGIRKKAKVQEDLEYYSVIRAIRSIEYADVCVLMVDATRGIEGQDQNIFSLIQRNSKAFVVCVNKWDLIEAKGNNTTAEMEKQIREKFAPFTDFPIVFSSALTKQRIFKVIEMAILAYENKKTAISTTKVNEFLLPLIESHPPPANKGKFIKVKYVTQLKGAQIPTFIFFANLPQYIKDPYKRYLENRIREEWDFHGTPIQLYFRRK